MFGPIFSFTKKIERRPDINVNGNSFDEVNPHYQENIVHEKQNLQLCAVHAVNNLLQISSHDADVRHQWQCGDQTLELKQAQLIMATKAEFNAIAESLTITENHLLSSDHSESNHAIIVARQGKLTLYEQLTSNHMTVLLGNYSFEVLHIALQNRGIDLDWCAPEGPLFKRKKKEVDGITTTESENHQDHLIECDVVGFIVNSSVDNSNRSILSFIPLIGSILGGSRHWYSISRIRRVLSNNKDLVNYTFWNVIDSDEREVLKLSSESELWDHLCQASECGGSIFRASLVKTHIQQKQS